MTIPAAIKVAVSAFVYWVVLLAVAQIAGDGPVLKALILASLPLAALAGLNLWRTARAESTALALRDDLTGLGNRRAFIAEARHMLRESAGGEVALMILDVDDLKSLNDACGHQAGDELLHLVASRLTSAPGSHYRIGGDEFACLLDQGSGPSLTAVVGAVRSFKAAFEACGHVHQVRMSYGYATVTHEGSFDALFRHADARLRAYKRLAYASGELRERRSQVPPRLAGPSRATEAPADAQGSIVSIETRRPQG